MQNDTRRVLVIDHDSESRRRLVGALQSHSLAADEAGDGTHAAGLLSRNQYGVILLAPPPERGDGLAVLELLDRSDALPVVLVLAAPESRLPRRGVVTRVHGIVKKPFDVQELAEVVADCARIHLRETADDGRGRGPDRGDPEAPERLPRRP